MAYNVFDTVETVIGMVSQDIRLQLSALGSPGQAILIDYVNRIHKQMLRFSRWGFLLSSTEYFMTTFGQTDYWIGALGTGPTGMVDTGLNLTNVDKIKKDEVRDFSNDRTLKGLGAQPIGPALNFRSGQARLSQPANFVQDWNDPNVLHIYPASDNSNPYQPVPSPPGLTIATAGSLPQRTYYVRITALDSIGGESMPSSVSAYITIPANSVLVVNTPSFYFTSNTYGIQYNKYNVYAAEASSLSASAEGTETLQTASGVSIGTDWQEPNSGLTTNGKNPPTASTIAQLGGYIIGFRYYIDRLTLNSTGQSLQIPNDYTDVLVQGVNYLAWKFLGKSEEAQAANQAYQSGLTEMIWDKNLFPDNDFIRPDGGSYVNQQILGYLPPFF